MDAKKIIFGPGSGYIRLLAEIWLTLLSIMNLSFFSRFVHEDLKINHSPFFYENRILYVAE